MSDKAGRGERSIWLVGSMPPVGFWCGLVRRGWLTYNLRRGGSGTLDILPFATPTGNDHVRSPDTPVARPTSSGIDRLVGGMSGPLGRMWSHGFRILFVIDAVGLFGAMVVINLVRFGREWPTFSRSYYFVGFLIATAIHLVINYFYGLYEREPRLGRQRWLSRALVATGIGVSIQAVAFVFLDRYLMPRLNLVAFLFVGTFVLAANRRISRMLTQRRLGPPRVVLVGAGTEIALAARHIAATEREIELIGQVDDPAELRQALEAGGGTDVLLLGSSVLDQAFPEPITSLEARGIGFLKSVGARDTLLGLRSVREIAGMPFVPLLVHSFPPYKARLKRLFDLTLVVLTLPVTIPLLALMALYVLACAGRPVLYRQVRVGKGGRHFTVVKFRTMTRDAEATGVQLATTDDQRVVSGLRWVRDTRGDELPQLWNVLRNEMSLVGPRPERPELTTDIERQVAGWVRRHQLPPGLTGLAQVNGRYATSAEYKIGYDLQYIVNWSPVLDVQILAQTVFVVLSRRV
ncbi:exopolysaccharide biosynthesis polyprenyl glycosylphosphotransferase [soil metagenome]